MTLQSIVSYRTQVGLEKQAAARRSRLGSKMPLAMIPTPPPAEGFGDSCIRGWAW